MNDMFNIRSFVGNQVEKLSSPKNLLVDKFRQTVDTIKSPFSTTITNQERVPTGVDQLGNGSTSNLRPSESSSSSSESSNDQTTNNIFGSLKSSSTPPSSQKLARLLPSSSPLSSPKILSNFKTFTDRLSRRQSILRRHVSESNRTDERNSSSTIIDGKSSPQSTYHNHPTIDINSNLNDNHETHTISDVTAKLLGRSRSLIRQSTDTTCTFPIRKSVRRMESIETVEIPGLNGVKSIRYLHDNLGKLQPDLYMKQTSQTDPTYGCGKIQFTLFYNQQISSLIVTIVSVDNLPFRDVHTKTLPDPFLKIVLLPDRRRKFQTKVFKRTQSTPINETFQFQINHDELSRRILLLSVYDFGRSSKRSLIGTVKIDDVSSLPDLTAHDVTCVKSIVPGTEVSGCDRFFSISVLHFFIMIGDKENERTGN